MEDSAGALSYSRDNVVTHPSLAAEIMMLKWREESGERWGGRGDGGKDGARCVNRAPLAF